MIPILNRPGEGPHPPTGMESSIARLSQLFSSNTVASFKESNGKGHSIGPDVSLDPSLLPFALRLVQSVGRNPDVRSAALAYLMELITEIRPDCVGSVFLYDSDLERFILRATHGLNTRQLQEFMLPANTREDFSVEELSTGVPMVLTGEEIYWATYPDILDHHHGKIMAQCVRMPLVDNGALVGFANFEHYSFTTPFLPSEVKRIEQLTGFAVPLLRNAQLYEQAQQREQEAASLNRVLQAVNASLDLDSILKTIRKGLASICRFDLISIVLLEPEQRFMKIAAIQGARLTSDQVGQYHALELRPHAAETTMAYVFEKNRRLVLHEITKDSPKPPMDQRIWSICPFRSAVFLPIRLQGEPIGVIVFCSLAFDLQLSDAQLALMERYVGHVGNAIENARLLEESRKAQHELMLKNISVQSQTTQIQLQNEALNRQQDAIMTQQREMESLMAIMQSINQQTNIDNVLHLLLDQGLTLVPKAQSAAFLVYNPSTDAFHCRAWRGYEADMSQVFLTNEEANVRYPEIVGNTTEVLLVRRGEAGDPLSLPRYDHLPTPEAMIVLRIYGDGKLVAFMVFDNYLTGSAFDLSDVVKMRRLQEHAASAFLKARFVEKIQSQHAELEAVYQKVSDSIGYARRILEAILPRQKAIDRAFPDAFVFFRPKDVVSGDFYWLGHRAGKDFIAAVDCTGHGIPGAFMAVLGNTLLGQIVNEKGFTDPGIVLNELNRHVKQMLNQTDSDSQTFDGMDVALISYDPETSVLQFAGANRSMLYIRDGAAHELKGTKQPVGGSQNRASMPFETNTLVVEPGDTVYIFTDGYVDQFGDASRTDRRNRKFLPGRLRELLTRIQPLPMHQQAEAVEWTIDEWRGNTAQLDDILVIGLRFGSA